MFLTSIALLLLCGYALGAICRKIKLPPLVGMLVTGIVLGPYALNLIAPGLLGISADLRRLALVIILTRAGLSLDFRDLKRAGRPAILMCFVPASLEIVGYIVFAPLFLGLTVAESALAGSVMAAVSPAVVVPRMLKLQKDGYGTAKCVPQTITAGASCDDVFVIVLFTALLGTASGGAFDFNVLWQVPVSIVLGLAVGAGFGLLAALFFRKVKVRDTVKILIFLCVSCLFAGFESAISEFVPFSGLLAVIAAGATMNFRSPERSARLAARYEKAWVFAEILLFALVGAEADVSYALGSFWSALATIVCALVFRTAGVFACFIGTPLSFREQLFAAIAYIPKATVQAAIGGLPLAAGLGCGKIILTLAVLAILVTAPLGALLTDLTYKKLLTRDGTVEEKDAPEIISQEIEKTAR